MKKIFALASLCLLFAANGHAQDKAVKFGLRLTPGLNSLLPDDEKDMAKAGSIVNFGWGGAIEFNLGDNAAIVTGLEILNSGGKTEYLDTAIMHLNDGDVIGINKDGSLVDTSGMVLDKYVLTTRRYRANYVSLPFSIKAKTNEIGYLTYFGQFGLNTAINTKGRSDDDVIAFGSTTTSVLEGLSIDNEVAPVKFTLQVGGGAEYNLSGSTSIVFSLHYNHGLTNVVKGKSKHLQNADGLPFEQKLFERGATLAVGILF